MSLGKTQALFVVSLLYAGAASVYIVTSMLRFTSQPSAADGFELTMAGFTFLGILGSAIAFMTLVALLDLIARREQQLLLALSIGLAAAATWEAVPFAFTRDYAYYKDMQGKPGEQPPAPAQ